MKVKLLKKIRKRFIIVHNPTGVYFYGDKIPFPFMVYDKNNEYSFSVSSHLNFCKDWILDKVRKEYTKQIKYPHDKNIKIWYKK